MTGDNFSQSEEAFYIGANTKYGKQEIWRQRGDKNVGGKLLSGEWKCDSDIKGNRRSDNGTKRKTGQTIYKIA